MDASGFGRYRPGYPLRGHCIMKTILQRTSVFLASGLMYAGLCQAATTTATFTVSATVDSQCQSISANALSFGNYNPASATDNDAQATFAVRCTSGTPIVVSLNKGTTTGGTIAQRLLGSGTTDTFLNYNLYTATGRSLVWGETAGTNTMSETGTGLGTDVSFTVFGRIPAGQSNIKPGNYADTITITVTY